MKSVSLVVVKPPKLTQLQKDEFVSFHQQYVSLDDKTILDHIVPRSLILLFYCKKNKKLVATVGIQLIEFKHEILIYFGNVVVSPRYIHEGCISYALAKYAIKHLLLNPLKPKYWCGLASSSGSFEYSLKLSPSWPNPDSPTPKHITHLMQKTLNHMGIDNYYIENGNVITTNLSAKVKGDFHIKKLQSLCTKESFFNKINPGAEQGEQVFIIIPITFVKALNVAIQGLHGHLIKCPMLYHKIVKYKNDKPYFALMLMIYSLFKIKN